MKRCGSKILMGMMVGLLFLGCQKKQATDYSTKTELSYASTKDIRNINPHLYRGEMAAQNMVFEPLVLNTKDGIKPWLAKRWEVKEGGKSYLFYLGEGVTFSDGSVLDAKAVKQNIDAILDNKARHGWLELVNEIRSTEVIAPLTFKLTLKHPYYPTLTELAMTRPFRFISPKCFVDGTTKNGVNCYHGTGPWLLKEHQKNAFALFKKNDQYWGEKPALETVKWRVMPDHQAMVLALQKREIDLIFGADGDMVDLNVFSKLQKENKYQTLLSEPIASRAILLNTKRPIVADIEVRKALQYAINKQAIVDGLLNGSESAALTLFAKSTPYCDVSLEGKTYNLKQAQMLLEKAGWGKDPATRVRSKGGQALHLKLYYNAKNAQEKAISEYIQSNLKEVGILLDIIGEEKQAFLDRQKSGDFDLQYALSWGIPYDPQSFISSWRMAAHGDYQAQLGLKKKAWLDALIQNILIEPTEAKRTQMYKELLSYIHEQEVYIPLSYSRTKAVYVPELQGVGFNVSQYEIPFKSMHFGMAH